MAPPTRTIALPVRFAPSLQGPLETPRDAGEGGEAGLLWPWPWKVGASSLRPLCLLQRKEPGWFVGEHMQDCRLLAVADGEETLTDLLGERVPAAAESLTRLGEAER
jgi:hypothetical protein